MAENQATKTAKKQSTSEGGESPTELWHALASRGYLGVNIPEEYGGGGLGISALAAVGEEISAAGCSLLLIVVSPAMVWVSMATRRAGTLPSASASTQSVPSKPSRSPTLHVDVVLRVTLVTPWAFRMVRPYSREPVCATVPPSARAIAWKP